MKISELKHGQKDVNVKGEIIKVMDVKTFPRMGEPGRVAISRLKDSTGTIDLTLWDEEIDKVKEGQTLEISNATVKQYNGSLQITTGRKGKITVLE